MGALPPETMVVGAEVVVELPVLRDGGWTKGKFRAQVSIDATKVARMVSRARVTKDGRCSRGPLVVHSVEEVR